MAWSKRFGWKHLLLVLVVVVIVAVLGFAKFARFRPVFIDKAGNSVPSPMVDIPREYTQALIRLYKENNLPTQHLITKLESVDHLQAIRGEFELVDGLSRVLLRDSVCYLDEVGTTAITVSPAFYAENFSEGVAAVATKQAPSSNTINVGLGGPVMTMRGWGFVDKSGNFVIPPTFDFATSFSEGLAMVEVDGKRGYIDKSGAFVIQPQFTNSRPFSEGLAAVEKDGKWGFIDKAGTEVIPTKFRFAESFSEGLAPAADAFSDWDKCWGFIDKSGNFVIPPKFSDAEPFSEGLAAVSEGDQVMMRWGFVDRSGKLQIKPKYMFVYPFKDGKALVQSGSWLLDLYSWLTYRRGNY